MTPDLGRNIEKYRRKKGITIEQLAERSYISIATLKGFLYRGENDPKLSTLINLATALDCTVNDLIGYRKPKRAEASEKVLNEIKEIIDAHFAKD